MDLLTKFLVATTCMTSAHVFAQDSVKMSQEVVRVLEGQLYENFSLKEITQKMPRVEKDFLKLVKKTFTSACYQQRSGYSFDFNSCVEVAKASWEDVYLEPIRDARQMRYALALWLYQVGVDDWIDIPHIAESLETVLQDENYEFYMVKGLESAFTPLPGIYGKDTPVLVNKTTHEMSLLAFSLRD